MTTMTLPESWYTDIADGIAHYAHKVVGGGALPICSTRETEAGDSRELSVGDRVCGPCASELRGGGADVALPAPLGRCLGCEVLQHVVDPGLVATHHPSPGADVCAGSGIRPAGFDGRDEVRAHALAQRATLNGQIQDFRRTVVDAIERGFLFGRMTDSFTSIMQMEGQLPFWDDLIHTGNVLEVADIALRIRTGKPHPGNDDAHIGRAVQIGAARRWLAANRDEIRKAAQEDSDAGIALLDAVLPAA